MILFIRISLLIQMLQINMNRGDGTIIAYDIVPFADGTNPTEPPVRIPPVLTGCRQANS